MHDLFKQLTSAMRPPDVSEYANCPVLSPGKALLNKIHWLIHDASFALSMGDIPQAQSLLAEADRLSHDSEDMVK